jgi:hypothetical protein
VIALSIACVWLRGKQSRHSSCPPLEGEQEVHGYFAEHELRQMGGADAED